MTQILCSTTEEYIRDTVVLTVKDTTVGGDGDRYKFTIDEHPRGTFIFNVGVGFHHYTYHLGRVTADFICIGRY